MVQCTCRTLKGDQCKKDAIRDKTMCYIHEGKCKTTMGETTPVPKAKRAYAKRAKTENAKTAKKAPKAKTTKPKAKQAKPKASKPAPKATFFPFKKASPKRSTPLKAKESARVTTTSTGVVTADEAKLLNDVRSYNDMMRKKKGNFPTYPFGVCQEMLKVYENFWKRVDPGRAARISTKKDLDLFKRRTSLLFHPDRHPESKRAWATAMMAELNQLSENCSTMLY